MGWIITGGIFLFLFTVALIPIRLIVRYDTELALLLQVLIFKINLHPSKPKKVRLRDYKPKNIRKREAAEARKLQKEKLKKRKEAQKEAKKAEKLPDVPSRSKIDALIELVTFIKDIVAEVTRRFAGYVQIDVKELKINVATGDAAKTATTYGVVYQIVVLVCEFLYTVKKFDKRQISNVLVTADFINEKSEVKIHIVFKLRIWHLIIIAIRAGFIYLKRLLVAN